MLSLGILGLRLQALHLRHDTGGMFHGLCGFIGLLLLHHHPLLCLGGQTTGLLLLGKQLGDLLGPMLFAVCMGTSRVIYGTRGHKLDLKKFMYMSVALCVLAYLVIIVVQNPVISLLGCGLAGFAVGIFWPGTFSMASAGVRNGGTLMFAFLALAGDLGCSGGPTLAGAIMSAFGGNMRAGIGAAVIFPVLMGFGLLIRSRTRQE